VVAHEQAQPHIQERKIGDVDFSQRAAKNQHPKDGKYHAAAG
jgi:hypothetical protein